MNDSLYAHLTDVSVLPQPDNKPIDSAIYKQIPSDFVVHELMEIDFTGEGEHLWLEVEKVNLNTTQVAKELAKWAKIPQRDVGYSGLKDRHAVTRQWFSLRIPQGELPSGNFDIDNLDKQETADIRQHHWHNKKLNRGTHKRNRFQITLKEVVGDVDAIEARLTQIKQEGVPNYFGEQRFGRDGGNIAQVLALFDNLLDANNNPTNLLQEQSKRGRFSNKKSKSRKERQQKEQQSILLSSARSAIFNQILARRVLAKNWNTAVEGDVFNLSGTGSVFRAEKLDTEIQQRLKEMDIHPTGAMWGVVNQTNDKSTPASQVQQLEQQVIEADKTLSQLARGLENMSMKSARRPLRLPIYQLSWQWQSDKQDVLVLTFELPTGSYATSLLASLQK